jgi:hypothetical protein
MIVNQKLFPLLPILFFSINFLFSNQSSAQANSRQADIRPNPLDEIRYRQSIQQGRPARPLTNSNIGKSDLGIQRPVEAKKTGFGYHFGFDTKLYFSSNPTSIDTGVLKESSGLWENSLRNTFLLGAFDLGGATFSPIANLSYTKFTHFGDELFRIYDLDVLGLNFAGIFQFGQGWSIRPGLGLTFDFDPRKGHDRVYHQISPSLSISKGFKMGIVQSFIDWSLTYNFTEKAKAIPGFPIDELNRFETAFTFGVNIPFSKFELSPILRFAYNGYSNQDRDDFMSNLGLDLKYSFSNWFYLKLFANLSTRQSNMENMDFNRFDTGLGAAFNAKF